MPRVPLLARAYSVLSPPNLAIAVLLPANGRLFISYRSTRAHIAIDVETLYVRPKRSGRTRELDMRPEAFFTHWSLEHIEHRLHHSCCIAAPCVALIRSETGHKDMPGFLSITAVPATLPQPPESDSTIRDCCAQVSLYLHQQIRRLGLLPPRPSPPARWISLRVLWCFFCVLFFPCLAFCELSSSFIVKLTSYSNTTCASTLPKRDGGDEQQDQGGRRQYSQHYELLCNV